MPIMGHRIYLLWSFLIFDGCFQGESSTQCRNVSESVHFPRVIFCRANYKANVHQLSMDGYFANSLGDNDKCTCVAFSDIDNEISFKQLRENGGAGATCGVSLTVTIANVTKFIDCPVGAEIDVRAEKNVKLVLTKGMKSKNTDFCYSLTGLVNSNITVTCFGNATDETTISTETPISATTATNKSSISSGKTTTPNMQPTFTNKSTESTTTSIYATGSTILYETSPTTTQTIRRNSSVDDDMIYIPVGSVVGVLLLSVTIVVVIICKRRHFPKPRESKCTAQRENNKYEDDGLRYNVLYQSASFRNEKNTDEKLGEANNDNGLAVNHPWKSKCPEKPVIASKPFQVVKQGTSSQNHPTTQHVIAPDEINEYAVVSKQGKINQPFVSKNHDLSVSLNKNVEHPTLQNTHERADDNDQLRDPDDEILSGVNTKRGIKDVCHYAELDFVDDKTPAAVKNPVITDSEFTITEIKFSD